MKHAVKYSQGTRVFGFGTLLPQSYASRGFFVGRLLDDVTTKSENIEGYSPEVEGRHFSVYHPLGRNVDNLLVDFASPMCFLRAIPDLWTVVTVFAAVSGGLAALKYLFGG